MLTIFHTTLEYPTSGLNSTNRSMVFFCLKVLTTRIKLLISILFGHLEISASAYWHRHRHWENFIFALLNVLWKTKHLYVIHSNILSCTKLCRISILLLQLLISLRSHILSLPKYPVNIYGGVLYRYISRPYWEF